MTNLKHTVQLAAEVSPGLRLAVEAKVRESGLRKSDVIRQALMAYLAVDVDGKPRGGRRGARA